jgi:hypothetical protein
MGAYCLISVTNPNPKDPNDFAGSEFGWKLKNLALDSSTNLDPRIAFKFLKIRITDKKLKNYKITYLLL